MFVEIQQYPTFSSTVLEKIYNSMDEGYGRTPKLGDFPFHGEAEMSKKKTCYKTLHEACLLERNLMEKRFNGRLNLQRRQLYEEMEMKPRNHHNFDHNDQCFSTSSCSSESSSGSFSSSESESVVGANTQTSCFTHLRLKAVRTKAPEKAMKTERALFQERSSPKPGSESGGNGVLRTKALKIFEQLKKSKQPISPGIRLASFINSLFSLSATGKKTGHSRSQDDEANRERKVDWSQASTTCSSASSFSRSCLSRQFPLTREPTQNGPLRRTVRFRPVSAIVNEDCRPCGHRCLYQEGGDGPESMPISVTKAWTIRRTQSRRADQYHPTSRQFMENSLCHCVKEEPEKGLLVKGYQKSQTFGLDMRRHRIGYRASKDEYCSDDNGNDDDAISCSSSDLFELPVASSNM